MLPFTLMHRVYPRVCGGTSSGMAATLTKPGLSPRVRGNRISGWRGLDRPRSIPACAGEPRTKFSSA